MQLDMCKVRRKRVQLSTWYDSVDALSGRSLTNHSEVLHYISFSLVPLL